MYTNRTFGEAQISPRIVSTVRSDKDTWDITTSVGSTALFVAAARALAARRENPPAVDPYAEVFCRAVGGEWADLLDGKAPDNKLNTEFGEFFSSYQSSRTRYFDDYFRGAADDGVRQIVILAAGLDSRAFRLAWPKGTIVFELDQPKVLEFKHDVLGDHGDAPTASRREIAVDLRDDWPKALRDNGFDPAKPSAWLAEGLLIYLPAAAQEQLFEGVDSLAAPGSHVAVEEMDPMDPGELEAKRAEERAVGDDRGQFFTLIYNEKHRDAGQWLDDHGWSAETTPVADYLLSVGEPVPPPDSEAGQMVQAGRLVSARRN